MISGIVDLGCKIPWWIASKDEVRGSFSESGGSDWPQPLHFINFPVEVLAEPLLHWLPPSFHSVKTTSLHWLMSVSSHPLAQNRSYLNNLQGPSCSAGQPPTAWTIQTGNTSNCSVSPNLMDSQNNTWAIISGDGVSQEVCGMTRCSIHSRALRKCLSTRFLAYGAKLWIRCHRPNSTGALPGTRILRDPSAFPLEGGKP